MTDTHEAVRLADFMGQFKTCGHQLEDGTQVHLAAAALLRRIPELEAELEAAKLGEATHDRQATEYAQRVAHWIGKFDEVKAERDQLLAEREKLLLVATGVTSLAYALGGMSDAQIGKEIGWLNKKALAALSAPTPPNADQKGL